jgi:uncharacterized membrane protein YeaQ/YmgE (transglycosylase-associated protein family)
MALLSFLLFGLLTGFLARALLPGKQPMSWFGTALLGCSGSFLGGFLGNLILGGSLLSLNSAGLIGSVIGAMVLLFAMRKRFR